jgi:hypothetical protein
MREIRQNQIPVWGTEELALVPREEKQHSTADKEEPWQQ